MRLEGKAAIVTGGGTGLGRAIALRFATEGARVAIGEIRSDAGDHTCREISDQGGEAISIPTDVTDPEQVNALVEACDEQFGRIDILVNNAGVTAGAPSPTLRPLSRARSGELEPGHRHQSHQPLHL